MGALLFFVLIAIAIACVVLLVRGGTGSAEDTERDGLREAYQASSLHEAHLVADLMRHAGLSVVLRNADIFSAAGVLPAHTVLPTLWVRGEWEFRRAREVVEAYEESLGDEDVVSVPDWTCTACGEVSPGNFEACWQCRRARPATSYSAGDRSGSGRNG